MTGRLVVHDGNDAGGVLQDQVVDADEGHGQARHFKSEGLLYSQDGAFFLG